jgi:FAD:protein FMN transferase
MCRRTALVGAALMLGTTALLATACRPAGDELESYRIVAMATWVDLSLPRNATTRDPGLVAAIEHELEGFGRDYYAWGDGELAALNRALTDQGRFTASDALAALLAASQSISLASGGAFDPGVGPLVELWGFQSGEPPGVVPDSGAIATLLARTGSIKDLVIDGNRIEAAPGAARLFKLDLGGIAKGAAVDRIVGMLEADGVAPALVNAGGDLRVVGARPDRPWRIGIAAPRGDGVLGVIELEPGEAAFTSGDYERYFERDGKRLHHILDPRTGFPAAGTEAVTVIAGEGTLADAAATAIFVAGDGWRETARALGIDAVLRVDARGLLEMTAAMRDRFQASGEVESDIIAAPD